MMRSKMKRALRASAEASRTSLYLPAPLRADASDGDKPKWQQLFPLGTFHNGGWPKEGVTIDAGFCDTMVANWKKRGGPALPVDYLHRGAFDELPVDQQIASGWIENLETRTDGLWAQVKWTPKARELITADEYRYLSPEFHVKGFDAHTGKPQGPTLVGAGLLNRPAFQEMPRVAAAAVVLPPAQTNPAAPEKSIMNKAAIIALLAKAGNVLDPNVTDEVAQAALSAHFDNVAANTAAALKAMEITDAETLKAKKAAEETTTLRAQLAEAIEEKAKLGVRVTNIEKVALNTAIDALCARAISEHRITAASQEQVRELATAAGIEKATRFVDSFPKNGIAPKGELGSGAGGAEPESELTQPEAHKKYMAAVDELQKTEKLSAANAFSRVNREQPLLAKVAHSRPALTVVR